MTAVKVWLLGNIIGHFPYAFFSATSSEQSVRCKSQVLNCGVVSNDDS